MSGLVKGGGSYLNIKEGKLIHKNKQGEVETYEGVGGRIDKVERIKFKIRQQLNGAGSRNPVIL